MTYQKVILKLKFHHNSSKLNKFLHSEVNLLIQHIIVQDQYGQNSNILITPKLQTVQHIY